MVWAGRKADDPPAVGAARAGDARRDRGRISPPALCRDDARRRSPDRRRLHAGQQEQRARQLLVRPDRQGPCQFRAAAARRSDARDGIVKRFARPRGCRAAAGIRRGRAVRKRRRAAGLAAHAGLAGALPSTAGCALPTPPRAKARPSAPASPSRCAPARCSAACWCIACCNRCPISPPTRRRELAQNYLARNADAWTEAEREALAEKVLALIAEPRFAAGVRAGQPRRGADRRPAGAAGGRRRWFPARSTGWWSRRAEILIVDYKTNHAPPGHGGGGSARAMSASSRCTGRCCQKLYPQRAVRAALLWTETPELMEISASALDAEPAPSSRREPCLTRQGARS